MDVLRQSINYFADPSRRSSMRPAAERPIYRSRWWMPGFALALGAMVVIVAVLRRRA